jgi:NAD(P)-dependent dehydrogenase (short-subunit alcohol dehydrogenase family)
MKQEIFLNKIAVIPGGSKGIGKAIAIEIMKLGVAYVFRKNSRTFGGN